MIQYHAFEHVTQVFTGGAASEDGMQMPHGGNGLVTRLSRGIWGGAAAPAVVDLAPVPFLGPQVPQPAVTKSYWGTSAVMFHQLTAVCSAIAGYLTL